MKEPSSSEQPAALTEIPMLAEYEDELAEPAAQPGAGMTAHEQLFGVYSLNELRSSRTQSPTDDLDWAQVVELRRRASEMITDEIQERAGAKGRPLGSDDRMLLGRALILFSSLPGLGIHTLLVGLTLDPSFKLYTSSRRAAGDKDLTPSTPAVFLPALSWVTLLTAKHLAYQDFINVFWSLRVA